MKNLSVLLLLVLTSFSGCQEKDSPDPCVNILRPTGSFLMREMVGDTAFDADTIFRDNLIVFQTTEIYDSVRWQVGTYNKKFTTTRFGLSFNSSFEKSTINFTGYKKPEPACFPDDKGIYSSSKQLTPVEQFDRSTLTVSPLVGQYHGYFTDNPADTFTVRIAYYDSTKYNTSITKTVNFYWISNIPKGYTDSTSAHATHYPELKNGLPMDMGYKGFVFGWNKSQCEYGRGWLSNDSLYINYGGTQTCKKQFIGKRR